MKFSSAKELEAWPSKAVTIMGMSGVGKTTLANLLRDDDWFHYSVDYRIGTRYMGEHIVDNFKREAMKNPFLRELLKTDSIYISSNITFDNLDPLSTYLGKPGNPDKGGIPFAEYKRRQAQHRQAEIQSLLDVPHFMDKARSIYAYEHFICDAGGSLCEVVNLGDHGDPVLGICQRAGDLSDHLPLATTGFEIPRPQPGTIRSLNLCLDRVGQSAGNDGCLAHRRSLAVRPFKSQAQVLRTL